jgi:hypothetical protein
LRSKLLGLSLFAAMASVGHAAIISGTLNFAGDLRVTATTIDFLPIGGGIGDSAVESAATNTGFATPLAETDVEMKDLDVAVQPVGVPFVLDNFMTFAAAPNIQLTLTFIEAGTNGPFTLFQAGPNAFATLNVRGTITDGSGDLPSTFVGAFSTQFPGQTTQQIVDAFNALGFAQASYSATFIATPIPEPGTVSLAAIAGLMLVGGGLLRRKMKA